MNIAQEQDGCWNCRFRVEQSRFDSFVDWPYWYCNFDDDCPVKDCERNKTDDMYLLVTNWQEAHEVKAWAKCKNWEN